MRYKALIVDFDNTIAQDGIINPPVIAAIKKFIATGNIFSIATGRPYYDAIDDACRILKLQTPVITYGGAHIINPVSGKILWKENIVDEEAKKIIQYFQQKDIYISMESESCVYTTDGNRLPLYAPDTPVKKISSDDITNIPKILISAKKNKFPEPYVDQLLKEIYSMFKDIHAIKIHYGGYFGFDITSSRASKHITTLELLKLLHLKSEETVGAGDGYNDYPLLTACGVKIAMGDAPQQLKDIADFIAPPQKEDGILSVIEKYFSVAPQIPAYSAASN